jgi:hypothetical protein
MDRLFKWPMEILRDESIAESVEYIKQLNYKPMLYIDGWWFETCRQINTKGLCLEFGVFEGASINFFSEMIKDRTWYGFDSFEGLQENWPGGYHGKGWFGKQGQIPKVNKNVKIVKGWFKDTLPVFFKKHKENISFIHIELSLSLLEARNLMKLNFTKDLASCSLPPVACRLTLVARGLTPVACCLKSSAPDARRLPPGARNFYNL